jgi:hypothetical protein
MKKLLLTLFATVLSCGFVSAQANLVVTAPNGLTTTQTRAPNGTSAGAYLRSCVLVLQSELAQIPATSTLTQFGFTLQSGTSGVSVPGNFTVYLQNTTDLTYQKGTSWSTALTGIRFRQVRPRLSLHFRLRLFTQGVDSTSLLSGPLQDLLVQHRQRILLKVSHSPPVHQHRVPQPRLPLHSSTPIFVLTFCSASQTPIQTKFMCSELKDPDEFQWCSMPRIR